MPKRRFDLHVIFEWDGEAEVWYATSEDLPGLVTEASDIPSLIQRVMQIAPELIADNLAGKKNVDTGDYLLNLVPLYQQTVRTALV